MADVQEVTRIVRAERLGGVFYGLLDEEGVREMHGGPFTGFEPTKRSHDLGRITLLPPVLPSKVVAVGMNYRRHIEEMGKTVPARPQLFHKPPSAVIATGERIVLPHESKEVHHEAELAVVIKRRARRVPPERAMDHVLGLTCLNDVTARDLQREDDRWGRAKGFDTFCPLGPCIAVGLDWRDLGIRCIVGAEIRQSSDTSDMIWDVPALVSYISQIMTLLPGDVIATGTPSGVGPLKHGDRVTVEIDGIGKLTNPVVDESKI